jgi:hypothetical protein
LTQLTRKLPPLYDVSSKVSTTPGSSNRQDTSL